MSIATWDIWLCDPRGNRIALLDETITFASTIEANRVGKVAVKLPAKYDGLYGPDYILDMWRTPTGGEPKQHNAYFIRRWLYDRQNDTDTTTLFGYDLNELLNRRIIAYYANTAYTIKTDNAGDIIKALVRENLGSSATDTDRNLASLGLAVGADLGDGYSITKGCSWRNLLVVCQEIAEASRLNGSDLYFGFVPTYGDTGTISPTFTTWATRPGQDHGSTSNSRVIFGETWGNLSSPSIEYDYTEEASVVYAGGQGDGIARNVVEIEDSTRSGRSVWGRREVFTSATGEDTTAAVTSRAQAVLEASRARLRFGATLLDSEQARYGIHWGWGDTVVAEYRGSQFDGIIKGVQIDVDDAGNETIVATLEIEADV
jgi:hypothetical protein